MRDKDNDLSSSDNDSDNDIFKALEDDNEEFMNGTEEEDEVYHYLQKKNRSKRRSVKVVVS